MKRIFIDGLSGMAQGLFATLIIGTIIQQIGMFVGGNYGDLIYLIGKVAAAFTGAGIGVGVARKLEAQQLVTVCAAVVGMIGAFAGKILAGQVLVDGNFDTVISVRELLRCADTGVGIGTALDGVITFENGAAYKTAPDGEVTVMRPEDSMAFAAAMVFDENAPEIALNGIDDLTSLKQMLAPFVQGNPNLFYMIKAGGVFKTMHTQSWNSCRKPYPVLSEAAKSRNEFCFENTRGNVIAVWCPRYVDGICIPDWHFHYLSSDKTQGGHILDLSAERLHLKINRIGRFDLLLPQTTEFAHCELREGKSAAAERFAACQATADKLL